jgi:hypothetical protein
MTDADDQGLFEWKPLQIKMRLLPADCVSVPDLLSELTSANLISPLDSDGKKLGAIRYFRRFQRPKTPNATFKLPPEWTRYVGLEKTGSDLDGEPVRDHFPTGSEPFPQLGEKSPQMEDEGCRREEEISAEASASPAMVSKLRPSTKAAVPSHLQPHVQVIWAAAPKTSKARSGREMISKALAEAEKSGHDPAIIADAMRAYFASDDCTRDDGKFAKGAHLAIKEGRWQAFAKAIEEIRDPATFTESEWRPRVSLWNRGRPWPDDWGPAPGSAGCLVPARLLISAAA